MLPGRIELRHTFEGETVNFILLRWFLTTAPLTAASGLVTGSGLGAQDGTTVTQVFYPAPYDQQSLVIEDLEVGVYNVIAYRSADGVNPTEEIFRLAVSADKRSIYQTEILTYIVDRGESGTDPDWEDPETGDIGIRDERLLDQSYDVYERGIGLLVPPSESTPEWEDKSDEGGGFDFTTEGKQFENGAIYWVVIQNRVDATEASGSSGSGEEVDGIVLVDDDTDFDANTMNGKLLVAAGAGTDIIVLSFANLSTQPNCSFKVTTHGGLQRYLSLQLDAGDTVDFRGDEMNAIHLGRGETISIMIVGNTMFVLNYDGDYSRLGQRIWGEKLELNTVYRDGTQYQQADYPRLMQFIESLPGGNVVTELAWETDKSKFARDDVGGTIRVPDDMGKFIRSVETLSVIPGTSQTDQIKKFWEGSDTRVVILKVDGTNTETATDPGADAPNIRFPVEMDESLFGTETRPINHSQLPLLVI